MQSVLRALLAASAFTILAASAQQPAVEVTLARLDCGTGFNDQDQPLGGDEPTEQVSRDTFGAFGLVPGRKPVSHTM